MFVFSTVTTLLVRDGERTDVFGLEGVLGIGGTGGAWTNFSATVGSGSSSGV